MSVSQIPSSTDSLPQVAVDLEISEKRKKWLNRSKEIPASTRKLFQNHISALYSAAHDMRGHVGRWSSHAHALTEVDSIAQDFFDKCKGYEAAKGTVEEYFKSTTAKIAALKCSFEVFTPPAASHKPLSSYLAMRAKFQPNPIATFRREAVVQSAANVQMAEKALDAVSESVGKVADAIYQDVVQVSKIDPRVHHACRKGREKLVQAVTATAKAFHKTGIPAAVQRYDDWRTECNEKEAKRLAQEHQLPYQMMHDYTMGREKVLSIAVGAVGSIKFIGSFKKKASQRLLASDCFSVAAIPSAAITGTPAKNLGKEVFELMHRDTHFAVKLRRNNTAESMVHFICNDGYKGNHARETLERIKDIAVIGNANGLMLRATFVEERLFKYLQKRCKLLNTIKGKEFEEHWFDIPIKNHIPNATAGQKTLVKYRPVTVDERLKYTFRHSCLKSGEGSTAVVKLEHITADSHFGRSPKFLKEIRQKAVEAGAQKLEVHFKGTTSEPFYEDTIKLYKYLGNESGIQRFEIPLH